MKLIAASRDCAQAPQHELSFDAILSACVNVKSVVHALKSVKILVMVFWVMPPGCLGKGY